MTLNWNQTASDCEVGRHLTELVAPHYTWTPDAKWQSTPGSDHLMPGERATRGLRRLLWNLDDSLLPGGYWARTRHRLSSTQGTHQIIGIIKNYAESRAFGNRCGCWSLRCRYIPRSSAPVDISLSVDVDKFWEDFDAERAAS